MLKTRLFQLATVLLLAITGSLAAWGAKPQDKASPFDKPIGKLSDLKEWTAPASSAAKAPKRVPDATINKLVGTYAEEDTSVIRGAKTWSAMANVKKGTGTNEIVISSFFGAATMTATMTSNTTFEIAPQVVYHYKPSASSETSYDVYLWAAGMRSDGEWGFSQTAPIEGTIDENGNITLAAWYMVSPDLNAYFDLAAGSTFYKANGTARHTGYAGTNTSSTSVPVVVRQLNDHTAQVVNFGGTVMPINVELIDNATVEVQPQYILSYGMFGDMFIYPADFKQYPIREPAAGWQHSYPLREALQGTVSGNTLNFGTWGIFQPYVDDPLIIDAYTATVITLNDGVTLSYPAAQTPTLSGQGTQASPYIISQASDVLALSQLSRKGETFEGKYVKVTQDVDLADLPASFRPIGTAKYPFNGDFDGGGFTIKNFSYTAQTLRGNGLFGFVGAQGYLHDLYLESTLSTGGDYSGALVGSLAGHVNHVDVLSDVSVNNSKAGGIAGYAGPGSLIENSAFSGTVAGYSGVGGIAGVLTSGTVRNCKVSATVGHGNAAHNIDSYAYGGVVGRAYTSYTGKQSNGETIIEDSYFTGELYTQTTYANDGGIVGLAVQTTVRRCFNAGTLRTSASQRTSGLTDVIDTGTAGGIVGKTKASTFTNCYNSNMVSNPYNSNSVGGIVGNIDASSDTASVFTNCYNSGQVFLLTETPTMGVYGTNAQDQKTGVTTFVNTYYDAQLTGIANDTYGKPTSYFTSGKAIDGYDASTWQFTADYYPTLKSFASDAQASEAATFSSMAALFNGNETSRAIKTAFRVTAPEGFSWMVRTGDDQYGTTGKGVTISGNTVSLTGTSATDTIVALGTALEQYKMIEVNTTNLTVFDGAGTERSPYLIHNASDLEALANLVNVQKQTFDGTYFRMTNDIDLDTASTFKGIGKITSSRGGMQTLSFGGTFDGGGHYIHNYRVEGIVLNSRGQVDQSKSVTYAGVFVSGNSNSVIKNLNIAADCNFQVATGAGPIVAITTGKVINCRNYANVLAAMTGASGIVSSLQAGGLISHCYNAGNLSVGSAAAGGITAAILRNNKTGETGTVEYCQNDGNISSNLTYGPNGAQMLGGIAGNNQGTVRYCVNNGTVAGRSGIGGIASSINAYGKIENSVNNAIASIPQVGSSTSVGALVGSATNANASNIKHAYYDNQLNVNGASTDGLGSAKGLSTSQLTSGQAIEGLSDSVFAYAAGSYPVLKEFASETASQALSKMWIRFADGEKANNISKAASLPSLEGATYALKHGDNSSFKLSASQLTATLPTDSVVTDSLTITYGHYTKTVPLRAVAALFAGAGNEQDPYAIRTVADMNLLAKAVNSYGIDYNGSFFKLINDIDFEQAKFTPIAQYIKANTDPLRKFQGTFDGNGKTIANVVVDGSYTTTSGSNTTTRYISNTGLFGIIGENGAVKNLTIKGGQFTGTSDLGTIAGRVQGLIDNCHNNGTFTIQTSNGNSPTGGIVGMIAKGGTVRNCTNSGHLGGKIWTGGIAGESEEGSLLENSVNNEDLNSSEFTVAAGIIGRSSGIVRNCVNNGNVTSTKDNDPSCIAGIAALAGYPTTIISCVNKGNITAAKAHDVGGIMGLINASTPATIDSCTNYGTVNGLYNVGGIVGEVNALGIITNSTNYGQVIGGYETKTSGMTYVVQATGGIAGKLGGGNNEAAGKNARIEHCRNLARISGNTPMMGGIVGATVTQPQLTVSYGTVKDSYNMGAVVGQSKYVGGIAGKAAVNIEGCFNGGNVIGNTDTCYTGGLVGQASGLIADSYNAATVGGADGRLGALVGEALAGASIARTFNIGTVKGKGGIVAAHIDESLLQKPDSVFSNIFYDTSTLIKGENDDAYSTGLTTAQLTSLDLGDAFENAQYAYPINKAWYGDSIADFLSATILPASGDTYGNITKPFNISVLPGVDWQGSSSLEISGNTVYGKALGKTTLYALVGKQYVKSFNLTISKVSGIEDIDAQGKQVASRQYYTVSGITLPSQPTGVGVYIERTVYTDGTSETRKVINRGN